jgi:methionyl-tRNA formyltransferase
MRIIFMGTPDYAVPTLRALSAAGHEIAAVYSQPPRPAGRRGLETLPSPVHRAADELGLPVRTPKSLRPPEEVERFAACQADAAVVVAYGLLLPETILGATRLGAWNGHASLLPRWRGAAPIQRAIMAGDRETGVMIMKMDKGLDTGPVALESRMEIPADITAGELHDRLSAETARLMVEAMARLAEGSLPVAPQPEEGVTYAAKVDKAETRIDFARPARAVHDHVRGLSPFPGAWTELPLGGERQRVKVTRSEVTREEGVIAAPGTVLDDRLEIACAEGAVRFLELQKAGGKLLDLDAFLRGASVPRGTVLD